MYYETSQNIDKYLSSNAFDTLNITTNTCNNYNKISKKNYSDNNNTFSHSNKNTKDEKLKEKLLANKNYRTDSLQPLKKKHDRNFSLDYLGFQKLNSSNNLKANKKNSYFNTIKEEMLNDNNIENFKSLNGTVNKFNKSILAINMSTISSNLRQRKNNNLNLNNNDNTKALLPYEDYTNNNDIIIKEYKNEGRIQKFKKRESYYDHKSKQDNYNNNNSLDFNEIIQKFKRDGNKKLSLKADMKEENDEAKIKINLKKEEFNNYKESENIIKKNKKIFKIINKNHDLRLQSTFKQKIKELEDTINLNNLHTKNVKVINLMPKISNDIFMQTLITKSETSKFYF